MASRSGPRWSSKIADVLQRQSIGCKSRTYYQVLQVDRNADPDIITAVYRRLAQRYHPDLNPSDDAVARMSEINGAYAVLRDPSRRAQYDAQLANGSHAGTGSVVVPPDPAARRHSGVLDFGRYRGWSLQQVARTDPDFLDWLERSPRGWGLREEIAMARQRAPSSSSHGHLGSA